VHAGSVADAVVAVVGVVTEAAGVTGVVEVCAGAGMITFLTVIFCEGQLAAKWPVFLQTAQAFSALAATAAAITVAADCFAADGAAASTTGVTGAAAGAAGVAVVPDAATGVVAGFAGLRCLRLFAGKAAGGAATNGWCGGAAITTGACSAGIIIWPNITGQLREIWPGCPHEKQTPAGLGACSQLREMWPGMLHV